MPVYLHLNYLHNRSNINVPWKLTESLGTTKSLLPQSNISEWLQGNMTKKRVMRTIVKLTEMEQERVRRHIVGYDNQLNSSMKTTCTLVAPLKVHNAIEWQKKVACHSMAPPIPKQTSKFVSIKTSIILWDEAPNAGLVKFNLNCSLKMEKMVSIAIASWLEHIIPQNTLGKAKKQALFL